MPSAFLPALSGRVNSAESLKKLVFISKFGSNSVIGFGVVTSPVSLKTESSGNFTVVAIGPPSGCLSEYKCQPGSTSAARIKSKADSASSFFSRTSEINFHFAGFCAKALACTPINNKISKITDFVLFESAI